MHEMTKGQSNPDHEEYLGLEAVSGTMQLGIVTANAIATSNTVSSSLPANQSLCDVLKHPNLLLYYFAARAASMASVISLPSGVTLLSQRLMIFPSRLMRNLPKFHFTSPGNGDSLPVSAA